MRNILVPVDFSEPSVHALEYARIFAEKFKAELLLVHISFPHMNPDNPNDDGIYFFKEEQKQLLKAFLAANQLPLCAGQILHGTPVGATIIRHSLQKNVGLIVMGTTGHSDILSQYLGSVSSHVAKNAHCPVLVVPHVSDVSRGINKIMVAIGSESLDKDSLLIINRMATIFKTEIHFVHITPNGMTPKEKKLEGFVRETWERKDTKTPFRYYNISALDIDITSRLDKFILNHSIDLAIMLTKHRKWRQDLFHKSQTKLMALHSKTPLLVLHMDESEGINLLTKEDVLS